MREAWSASVYNTCACRRPRHDTYFLLKTLINQPKEQSMMGLRVITAWALMCVLALPAQAASRVEIDAKVSETLTRLYQPSPAARHLGERAAGILVFPEIIKAGLFLGAEYGEGALLENSRTVGYHNIVSGSIGLQIGAQLRSQVIMFLTQDAYDKFRASRGWEAGVDGSVAIAQFGAGKDFDTKTVKSPIVGFVLSNRGLMANISIEGSKISRIKR